VCTPFDRADRNSTGTPDRETNFADKAQRLSDFSTNAVRTARDVAFGSSANKRHAERLLNAAANVESLCPQLINAGRIRFTHPDNSSADKHFDNLRTQYADSLQEMRNLVDEAIDPGAFLKATGTNNSLCFLPLHCLLANPSDSVVCRGCDS
jgi:vinculin